MRHCAALEGKKDEVSAAADAELIEQVRDVKFHGPLGDIQFAGNFLVGEIFEERIENFLFAATEIRDRIGFQAARLIREDGINEAGENGTWNPEAAISDQRQRTDELLACFFVSEYSFHAKTQ